MLAFAAFWFLFNFNGFQTMKLQAGHVQNGAYLLIPGFLYLLRRQT